MVWVRTYLAGICDYLVSAWLEKGVSSRIPNTSLFPKWTDRPILKWHVFRQKPWGIMQSEKGLVLPLHVLWESMEVLSLARGAQACDGRSALPCAASPHCGAGEERAMRGSLTASPCPRLWAAMSLQGLDNLHWSTGRTTAPRGLGALGSWTLVGEEIQHGGDGWEEKGCKLLNFS